MVKLIINPNLLRKLVVLFSIVTGLFICLVFLILVNVTTTTVEASGGAYSITFTAADAKLNNGPYNPTYQKYTPAGLACPGTSRANDPLQDAVYASPLPPYAVDSVTSLAPSDMALGQIVPFEIVIQVNGNTTPENGVIRFKSGWKTQTTSNDDFGYDDIYGVYCAFIDTADSYFLDQGTAADLDWFTSNLVSNEIQGEFQLSGLDNGDKIVLEVWMVLDNVIPAGATGNVQSRMISAQTVAVPPDTIQVGNQTIPLNKIGEFFRASADLQISKIDNPNEPMIPLEIFDYIISVWNTSVDTTSNGVVITDTLDDYVQFLNYQVEDPGGFGRTCVPPITSNGGVLFCDLKALSPGEIVPITVTVSILKGVPVSSDIETPDCVFGDHNNYDICNFVQVVPTITQDDNLSNNSDTEPKDVKPVADLGIVLDCPGPIISDPLQHCLAFITNHGPQDAFGVVMTDTLPMHTTFITYTANMTTTLFDNGTTLIFNLLDDPLEVDEIWQIDMTWDMSNVISTTSVTVTNTAVVSANTLEPIDAIYPNFDTCSITPATLTFFNVSSYNGWLKFEWQTSKETGVVGYNIYRKSPMGLEKINENLISSYSISSLEPRLYQYEVLANYDDEFILEEMNVFGVTRHHGPFKINQPFGELVEAKLIDWKAIRSEYEQKIHKEKFQNEAGSLYNESNLHLFMPVVVRKSNPQTIKYYTFSPVDIQVSRDGIYRITYEQFLENGIDLAGINPAAIALRKGNLSIPIHVVSGDSFGLGSYLEFYGQAIDSMYTRTNVYTLINDASLAVRVPEINSSGDSSSTQLAYIETLQVDKNLAYGINAPYQDPWFEREIRANASPVTANFDLSIDHYQPGIFPSVITIGVWGQTDYPKIIDHHLLFSINGFQIGEVIFDGIIYKEIQLNVPDGLLHEGINQLSITLPGVGVETAIAVDRYSLNYPRSFFAQDGKLTFTSQGDFFEVNGLPSAEVIVYRIDDQLVQIKNLLINFVNGSYTVGFSGTDQLATYVVYSTEALNIPDQISPASPMGDIHYGKADLLIVSHPDFLQDLDPYIEARTNQGFNVKLVDVNDIYSFYNYKVIDPKAIQSYITYSYQKMGVKYVLLVGGDTYDYLDYSGLGSVSFIPSLYRATNSLVRHSPIDAYYADINGDGYQDLAIGRLPVRTSSELKDLITKIISYQEKAYGNTALFAAGAKDGILSFAEFSDELIQISTPGWNVQKAYVDELGTSSAKQTIINAINEGRSIVNYIGHSSDIEWDSALLTLSDVQNLNNFGLPTVVNTLGCWNSYYVMPNHVTLADTWLLGGENGAVSLLGSVTLTGEDVHEAFGTQLFSQLLQPGVRIGDALMQARRQILINQPTWLDAINAYMLLGDPTLVINP